ncbi:MAG: hypothetical protein ACT6TF_03665, partial [Microbacterium aurantiacum]
WEGLGRGHGYLSRREVTLRASSRRWPSQRRARVLLPNPQGGISSAPEPLAALEPQREGAASVRGGDRGSTAAPPMRAVG